MTEVITIHDHNQIDFDRPGKTLYEVAFHYDGLRDALDPRLRL